MYIMICFFRLSENISPKRGYHEALESKYSLDFFCQGIDNVV